MKIGSLAEWHISEISDVFFKWLIGTICGIEAPPLYGLIIP